MFGVALATVILPSLSEKHANADPDTFSHTIDWALRWVLVIGTPAAVALAVLAVPILSTLFLHGKVTAHDVLMARLSLMAYSFGLLGFILVKVLAPGFFARQDTKTPVRFAVIAMVVNMVCNVAFVVPMVLLDIEGPHMGLALATTLSSFVNSGLLLRGLWKSGVYRPDAGWLRLAGQVLFANTVMLTVLWFAAGDVDSWIQAGIWTRVIWLAGVIAAGAGSYFVMLLVLGVRVSHLMHRPAA